MEALSVNDDEPYEPEVKPDVSLPNPQSGGSYAAREMENTDSEEVELGEIPAHAP